MLAVLRTCNFALPQHMEFTAINKVQSGLGTAASASQLHIILLQSQAVYCNNLLPTISDLKTDLTSSHPV